MCFSCMCLFILHALICVPFLLLLVSGLAVACDCGTPWTFPIPINLYFYCNGFR